MTTKIVTITERAKETASKIRKALKATFPGTKFSVRASEYSMGSSVNVSWTDLPTSKEVEVITNKFRSGSFNGMEDMYETSGYMFEGKRVIGAKYITTSRSLSDEYKEEIENFMNEYAPHIAESTYYTGYTKLYKAEEYMLEQQVKEVAEHPKQETKQPQTNKITNNNTDDITVEMNLNNDLNGVELRFSDKPSEAVRNELKANKFRYSKPQNLWYAKQSNTTILFAESLVSIYNDVTEEVEQVETVEEVTEVTEQNENTSLIGRKVFGQWGVMSGSNYGVITNVIEDDVIITWEDWEEGSSEQQVYIKDLIVVDENTSLDPVGIYLLENKLEEVATTNEEIHITGDMVEVEPKEEAEITPSQNGKYKVKEILFIWSEYSSIIANNTKVNNFQEANDLIKKVAHDMEEDSGYYKTKFVITWENGYEYTGRIDIEKEYLFQQSPLKEHIENHCMFYGGTKKPHWMSETDYNNHVNMASKEEQHSYIKFLETYSLEDEKTITAPTKESGKVLDFSSKFKQKQEQEETEKMMDHFLQNVLPYMDREDQLKLTSAYRSNNDEEVNKIWNELMLSTTVKRARKEMLQK
jgi:hypothetical protein